MKILLKCCSGKFHDDPLLGLIRRTPDITLLEIQERNRSHPPPAVQAVAFAGIMGSVRFARAAAMIEQA